MANQNPYNLPQGVESGDVAQQGVLEIDATITNPLFYLSFLHFFTLNINLNGVRYPGGFKRNSAPLNAGQYQLHVSFTSLFGDASPAWCDVLVYPGHATVLTYEPGFFLGMNGTLVHKGYFPLNQ